MIYLQLFWSFFQVGLFSFGGGYAAMPLIQHQVVEVHPWLTMGQFSDIITISQMTPGPVALNSATFVGIQTCGVPGALVATLGCIAPSCLVVMLLAFLYQKYRGLTLIQGVLGGLRPAVTAMIASAGLSILLMALFGSAALPAAPVQPDWVAAGLFGVGLFILRKWKPDPLLVMAGAGLMGILLYAIT